MKIFIRIFPGKTCSLHFSQTDFSSKFKKIQLLAVNSLQASLRKFKQESFAPVWSPLFIITKISPVDIRSVDKTQPPN